MWIIKIIKIKYWYYYEQNTDASILVYKVHPERTGFTMYAEYMRPQLTFLALVPWDHAKFRVGCISYQAMVCARVTARTRLSAAFYELRLEQSKIWITENLMFWKGAIFLRLVQCTAVYWSVLQCTAGWDGMTKVKLSRTKRDQEYRGIIIKYHLSI